jgi:ribonuclease VapC
VICDSSAVVAVMLLTAKLRRRAGPLVARFLQEAGIDIVPFGADHWRVAVEACARYGNGRHPAALNLGDCLVYAVAKLADQPLLCVGSDFAKTDLPIA